MRKINKFFVLVSSIVVIALTCMFAIENIGAIEVESEIGVYGAPSGLITKSVRNVSSSDGKHRVGDILEYTVTLSNENEFSVWEDITVVDELPIGIEFIDITRLNSNAAIPTDFAYDATSRKLRATLMDDLYGVDETREGDVVEKGVLTFSFTARITSAAYNKTITNHIAVVGSTSDTTAHDEGVYVEASGTVVTIHYQNEQGQAIADDVALVGNIGETYQTQAKTIQGYILKEVIGEESGVFGNTSSSITYVYTNVAPSTKPSKPQNNKKPSMGPATGDDTSATMLLMSVIFSIGAMFVVARKKKLS